MIKVKEEYHLYHYIYLHYWRSHGMIYRKCFLIYAIRLLYHFHKGIACVNRESSLREETESFDEAISGVIALFHKIATKLCFSQALPAWIPSRLSYATARSGVIQKNNKKCYKVSIFLLSCFRNFLAMTDSRSTQQYLPV